MTHLQRPNHRLVIALTTLTLFLFGLFHLYDILMATDLRAKNYLNSINEKIAIDLQDELKRNYKSISIFEKGLRENKINTNLFSNTTESEINKFEKNVWRIIDLKLDEEQVIIFSDKDRNFISIQKSTKNKYLVISQNYEYILHADERPARIEKSKNKYIVRKLNKNKCDWAKQAPQNKFDFEVILTDDCIAHATRLLLTKPIYSEASKIHGVIAISINAEKIKKIISKSMPDATFKTHILNNDISIIDSSNLKSLKDINSASSERGLDFLRFTKNDPIYLKKTGKFENSIFQYSDSSEQYWAAILKPPESNFKIITIAPETKLIKLTISKIAINLGVSIACLGLLLLLFIWNHGKTIHEIEFLRRNIAGYGNKRLLDLSKIKKNRKLKEIGLHFNSIISQLKTDQLTGVMNKDAFINEINSHNKLKKNFIPANFAILFIDLDGFKEVNDQHGHHTGDEILRVVAKRMHSELREFDLISRFGGDEFVIYLNEMTELKSVQEITARLRLCIEKPIEISGIGRVAVGASIGMALCPADGLDFELLMQIADHRMYKEKNQSPHNEILT